MKVNRIYPCYICKKNVNRLSEESLTVVTRWFCNLKCYKQIFENDDCELS